MTRLFAKHLPGENNMPKRDTLPSFISWEDIKWDVLDDLDKKIIALLLAWRERAGFKPFVGERDFRLAQGTIMSDSLLDFTSEILSYNESSVEKIHENLGYDMWQNWDDTMLGVIRPNGWTWLWHDFDAHTTTDFDNETGSLKKESLLNFSNWDSLNKTLVRTYNAYNWDAVVGTIPNGNTLDNCLSRIKKLINNMYSFVFIPQTKAYSLLGSITDDKRGSDSNVDKTFLWKEACSLQQSITTRTLKNKVTIDCYERNKCYRIRFDFNQIGEIKIFNPYSYPAHIYIGCSSNDLSAWSFGMEPYNSEKKGVWYIGKCAPYSFMKFSTFSIENLKEHPPASLYNLDTNQSITHEITFDWIEYRMEFEYGDGHVYSHTLPHPTKFD